MIVLILEFLIFLNFIFATSRRGNWDVPITPPSNRSRERQPDASHKEQPSKFSNTELAFPRPLNFNPFNSSGSLQRMRQNTPTTVVRNRSGSVNAAISNEDIPPISFQQSILQGHSKLKSIKKENTKQSPNGTPFASPNISKKFTAQNGSQVQVPTACDIQRALSGLRKTGNLVTDSTKAQSSQNLKPPIEQRVESQVGSSHGFVSSSIPCDWRDRSEKMIKPPIAPKPKLSTKNEKVRNLPESTLTARQSIERMGPSLPSSVINSRDCCNVQGKSTNLTDSHSPVSYEMKQQPDSNKFLPSKQEYSYNDAFSGSRPEKDLKFIDLEDENASSLSSDTVCTNFYNVSDSYDKTDKYTPEITKREINVCHDVKPVSTKSILKRFKVPGNDKRVKFTTNVECSSLDGEITIEPMKSGIESHLKQSLQSDSSTDSQNTNGTAELSLDDQLKKLLRDIESFSLPDDEISPKSSLTEQQNLYPRSSTISASPTQYIDSIKSNQISPSFGRKNIPQIPENAVETRKSSATPQPQPSVSYTSTANPSIVSEIPKQFGHKLEMKNPFSFTLSPQIRKKDISTTSTLISQHNPRSEISNKNMAIMPFTCSETVNTEAILPKKLCESIFVPTLPQKRGHYKKIDSRNTSELPSKASTDKIVQIPSTYTLEQPLPPKNLRSIRSMTNLRKKYLQKQILQADTASTCDKESFAQQSTTHIPINIFPPPLPPKKYKFCQNQEVQEKEQQLQNVNNSESNSPKKTYGLPANYLTYKFKPLKMKPGRDWDIFQNHNQTAPKIKFIDPIGPAEEQRADVFLKNSEISTHSRPIFSYEHEKAPNPPKLPQNLSNSCMDYFGSGRMYSGTASQKDRTQGATEKHYQPNSQNLIAASQLQPISSEGIGSTKSLRLISNIAPKQLKRYSETFNGLSSSEDSSDCFDNKRKK